MSASFELLPAISPPTVDTLVLSDVDDTDNYFDIEPGVTCLHAEGPVFLAVLLVGQNYPYSLMPIETGTPYLLSAAAHSQLLLTSASSSQVWTFPVEGNKKQIEWVPMQAPEYVGIYPVSTTPVDFDLGVTGITEIYIAPEDIVVVVFGKSGDDLSAANPMPIYPASPMRFKLGPASRRMRLIAAAPTNLTIAFIGRAD